MKQKGKKVHRPVRYGNYILLDRLNVGGMAEVFRAKSTSLEGVQRLVAIKRILPHLARDPEFTEMFVDEARISVTLHHANIAQVYELGRVDESLYIAMEFVHGRDLRTLINRMRRLGQMLPIPLVAHAIAKVCEGLDHAHRKKDIAMRDMNIVHRDISPQNVIISFEGEVKVIDFGIAKAASKRNHTEAGILKGKFGYMAPEQVMGEEIDRRADIFCAGILMYEMLTAERLFAGSNELSTLQKIRNVDVTPPTILNPNIPDELEEIILKALAAHPHDRYQWASDLQEDLQPFQITHDNKLFTSKRLRMFMVDLFQEEVEEDRRRLEQLMTFPVEDDEDVGYEDSGEDTLRLNKKQMVEEVNLLEEQAAHNYPHTPRPQQNPEWSGAQLQQVEYAQPASPYQSASHGYGQAPAHQFNDPVAYHPALPEMEEDPSYPGEDETALVPPAPPAYDYSTPPPPVQIGHSQEEILSETALLTESDMQGVGYTGTEPELQRIPASPIPAAPMPSIPMPSSPPPKPRKKKKRVLLWSFLWSIFTILFAVMLYLLFVVPAPKIKSNDPDSNDPPTARLGNLPPPPGERQNPITPPYPSVLPGRRAVPPKRIIPKTKKAPKRRRTRLRRRRRRSTPRPSARKSTQPKTQMLFLSVPRGAQIFVDDRHYGETPKQIRLPQRSKHYRLMLLKKGYTPYRLTFRVLPDEPGYKINGALTRTRRKRRRPPSRSRARYVPPKSKKKGFLSAKGQPFARISIDGKDTGRYVLFRYALPPGKHTVSFSSDDGKKRWSEKVTIRAGQTKNLISRYKK